MNLLLFALLALMTVSCGSDDQSALKAYLEKGQKSFDSGIYEDAITAWEKALTISSSNQELRFRLALAHQNLAQFESSSQQLRLAIKSSYKTVDAYFMIAQNDIFSGNFGAAKDVCDKLESMISESYNLVVLKGDIATVMAQYLEGERYYKRAIELDDHRSEAFFKLAANLLVQEKNASADRYYDRGVEIDEQTSVQYWLHRAEYQAMKGNSEEAETAMKRALAIQPKSLFIKLKIIQFLLVFKKYEALIDFIDKFNLLSNNHPAIQKLFAEALLNTNQLEQADGFLQNQPVAGDSDWLLLLGKKSFLQGSLQHAINRFEQALDQRKSDPNGHYMLALAYLAAGKENLSKRTLIRLLSIYPEMSEAELALAGIHYKEAEYDLSIDYLERIIDRVPENFRAYILLGNCMLAMGRYDAAQSNFQKALILDPQSMTVRYYLALVKDQMGQVSHAVRMYRSILTDAPHMADAGLRLADLLILKKRGKEAIAIFTPMVEEHSDNGYLKFILGYVYQALNQPDTAARYYRLAVKDNSEILEAYKRLADMQLDNESRIAVIQDALKQAPNSTELKTILANYYFMENDLDSALIQIKDIYLANPQRPSASNNLSWLYLEMGINLQHAFDLARTAFEMAPENPQFAHTLGWAFHKKGMHTQAEWHIKEAIKLVDEKIKDDGEKRRLKAIFSYHLGLTLQESGQLGDAEKRLVFAVKLGLPPKYEGRARALLEKMSSDPNRG